MTPGTLPVRSLRSNPSSTHLAVGKDGIWALAAVVVHGLVSYFAAPDAAIWPWGIVLVVASAVYVAVGVFTQPVAGRLGLSVYLTVQTILAAGIVWLGRGHGMLAPLPVLVVYTLVWPRAAVAAAAIAHTANVQACLLYFQGAARMEIVGAVIAGEVFVVAFTELALRERKARDALAEAHAALAARAEQAEAVATLEERNRVARELHDTLGHYLTVVHVHLQAAQRHLEQNPATAREALVKSTRLTHECIEDVRRSVTALRGPSIGHRPLTEAVVDLAQQAGAAGMRVSVRVDGEPHALSPAVELALFRAVQEGLTNVRKHSSAREADVTLTYSDDAAQIAVHDPGEPRPQAPPGFGLRGLRERAELLGGALAVARDAGFTLTLRVPSGHRL